MKTNANTAINPLDQTRERTRSRRLRRPGRGLKNSDQFGIKTGRDGSLWGERFRLIVDD